MDYLFHPCLNATVIATLAALILTCYLLRRSSARAKAKQPPEAAGGRLIFGHIHLLAGPKLLHETLGALADEYGSVFRIRVGLHPTVVISSWKAAKECFTTYDAAVSSRPKITCGKLLGYNFASLGFCPYGSYWRELRKITVSELLSNRRLQQFSHIRGSEVETSLKELYRRWVEKKDEHDSSHALVEMKQWFGDLTLNVLLRMIAGKRYAGSAVEGDEGKAHRCQKVMREFFHLAGILVMADAVPFLEWLDIGGHQKAMKKIAREMDGIFQEWLDEHQQNKKKGLDEASVEQDFMDVLLSVIDMSKVSSEFDNDTINKATTMTLAAGGTDTTAITLTWGVALLLNNPRAMESAQQELDMHIGKERLVKESDLSKLLFIQAIVKETLRLCPPSPLSGIREFTEDCTIGGFHVPSGTRLLVNLWKLHKDPYVWDEPHEFKPERFLTTHKEIDIKGQHFELIPFGGGRRACPGLGLGLQMAQLTLASLLHAYDIRTPDDKAVDMTGAPGLTMDKATPLEVLVKPRLSPSAYK